MQEPDQPSTQPEGTIPPTPPTSPQDPTIGNSMDGMQAPTPPVMPPQPVGSPTPPVAPAPMQQDVSQLPPVEPVGPTEAPTTSMPAQPVAPVPNNLSDQKPTIGYLAVGLFWVPIVGLVLSIMAISRGRRSNNKKLTMLGWVGLGLWLVVTILVANSVLSNLDDATSELGL